MIPSRQKAIEAKKDAEATFSRSTKDEYLTIPE